MTPPPRLAPLETMTEADYRWCHDLQRAEHAAFSLVLEYLAKTSTELEAQRLARARERQEFWQAALEAVMAERLEEPTSNEGDQAYDVAVDHCLGALVALRDREEA